MLETLEHPDLIHMILHYLLAMQESPQTRPPMPPRSSTASERQSSLLLMTRPIDEDDVLEPALFNLVDLILGSLQSTNPQTVLAALKLSTTMLSRHRTYAALTLLRTSNASTGDSSRTIGSLNAEMEDLLELAARVGSGQGLDDIYAAACEDLRPLMEAQLPNDDRLNNNAQDSDSARAAKIMTKTNKLHIIAVDDPFSSIICSLMESFLTNSVYVNFALTETVTSLASCSNVSLEGWLAVLSSKYQYDPATSEGASVSSYSGSEWIDEEEKAALLALRLCNRQPHWAKVDTPRLVSVLKSVEGQVEVLRSQYPDLDDMLAKRKEILRGSANDSSSQTSTAMQSLLAAQVPRSDSSLAKIPQRASSTGLGSPSKARRRSTASHQRAAAASPALGRLSISLFRPPPPSLPNSPTQAALDKAEQRVTGSEAQLLKRRVQFPLSRNSNPTEDGDGAVDREVADEAGAAPATASLSHVLTNIVILQDFVLELVAVMQMRALVFDEVRFA